MTRIAMNIFKGLLALLFLIQLAQGQQAMPVCASRCLETHLKQSTCSATDFGCICADQQLQANVGTCTLGSCTLVEALAAKNVTATLCNEPVRDNSTTTPVVTAISGALAVIFVAIRLLNNHLRGALNTADLCAVLALVSSIPMDVIEFYNNNVGAATWSVLECNVGIVCCCMPYVRSLLNRVFPNCFGGTFFSSGGKKGQKYHTMTSTTAEGGGSQKLQQQSTNATATTATTTTATTDEAGGDGGDDRRKSLRVPSSKKDVENSASAGPRRGHTDTIELKPIEEGSLAKYPEW
ncbi:hypothetical protein PG995_010590 [Apiospora arundinis]